MKQNCLLRLNASPEKVDKFKINAPTKPQLYDLNLTYLDKGGWGFTIDNQDPVPSVT